MAFTITKKIGSGQVYTTLQSHEDGAPVNYTTAEKSAAGTFAVAAFVQGETLSFVGSGAAGKFLDTDSTGVGTGTYVSYGITSGNPAASDVVTGATSGATCILSSGTPTASACVWQGAINAASDAFSSSTTLLTVAGGTVSSSAYYELTTAAGASFRDNVNVQTNALRYNASNGCAISLTGDYATAIICNQGYSQFSYLQVQSTAAHSAAISCQPDTAGVNDWNGCILESNIQVGTVYGNIKIRNSLLVSRSGSLTRILICSGTSPALYNNTIVVPSDKAKASDALTGIYVASQVFQNNAFFGVTNVAATSGRTFTTCGTDDATPPTGCTTYTYNTSLFVNITDSTRDFRIPSGSSLIGAGTTDATNAAVDIAGTTRTGAWDIGCWQYVSAGQVKKIDGLAIASVKAILGTAKGSLKKWDGLTL